MSSCRQQALIEAPIGAVWSLVGDPRRYPEWAGHVVQVTGLPSVDEGATYRQVTRLPLRAITTDFLIDSREDMRDIRLRCLRSGFYSRWLLTEARGATFAEAEVGMEPPALRYRAVDTALGWRWYRRILHESFDGLRAAAERQQAVTPG